MRERKREMTGRVVSDKMAKTVIVEIERRSPHPLYGKVVTKRRRFKAHNVEPTAKLGDLVTIRESRPLSHDKRWVVEAIVQRGVVVVPIVEVELESLRAQEEADRAVRRVEEERRAAERLAKLAGEEEEESAEEEPSEETETEESDQE